MKGEGNPKIGDTTITNLDAQQYLKSDKGEEVKKEIVELIKYNKANEKKNTLINAKEIEEKIKEGTKKYLKEQSLPEIDVAESDNVTIDKTTIAGHAKISDINDDKIEIKLNGETEIIWNNQDDKSHKKKSFTTNNKQTLQEAIEKQKGAIKKSINSFVEGINKDIKDQDQEIIEAVVNSINKDKKEPLYKLEAEGGSKKLKITFNNIDYADSEELEKQLDALTKKIKGELQRNDSEEKIKKLTQANADLNQDKDDLDNQIAGLTQENKQLKNNNSALLKSNSSNSHTKIATIPKSRNDFYQGSYGSKVSSKQKTQSSSWSKWDKIGIWALVALALVITSIVAFAAFSPVTLASGLVGGIAGLGAVGAGVAAVYEYNDKSIISFFTGESKEQAVEESKSQNTDKNKSNNNQIENQNNKQPDTKWRDENPSKKQDAGVAETIKKEKKNQGSVGYLDRPY